VKITAFGALYGDRVNTTSALTFHVEVEIACGWESNCTQFVVSRAKVFAEVLVTTFGYEIGVGEAMVDSREA